VLGLFAVLLVAPLFRVAETFPFATFLAAFFAGVITVDFFATFLVTDFAADFAGTTTFLAADFAGTTTFLATDFTADPAVALPTGSACALVRSKTAVGSASDPISVAVIRARRRMVWLIFFLLIIRAFR